MLEHTVLPSRNRVWKSVAIRGAVVLAALAIIYVRIPYDFTHAQIVGEDGAIWLQAYIYGSQTLLFSFVGYLITATRIIALFTQLFPLEYFPYVFFYAGVAVDLLVVWTLMSPRLELPYRPLVALAVVCTAQGFHIIGVSMSHIQWVLPLGVLGLMFMRPSGRNSVRVSEMALVAASALTGPFALFFVPLFPLQTFLLRNDRPAMRRMAVLTATHLFGALCQILSILFNIDQALQPNLRTAFHWTSRSDWAELILLSFQHFFMSFGAGLFHGRSGVVIGLIILAASTPLILWFLYRSDRYRVQLLFMLLFSGFVVGAGIVKVAPQERYFYISGVLVFWVACCLVAQIKREKLRYVGVTLIAACQLYFVFQYRDTYLLKGESDWPRWAKFVHSGLPLTVSVLPPTWFINIPADSSGPLFSLNSWVGKDIASFISVGAGCGGSIDSVTPLDENYYVYKRSNVNHYEGALQRWVVKGKILTTETDIIAIASLNGRVVGFGVTGFGNAEGGGWKWIATVPADESKFKAYALSRDNRRACELSR